MRHHSTYFHEDDFLAFALGANLSALSKAHGSRAQLLLPASRIAAVASLEFLAGTASAKLVSPGSLAHPFGLGCRKITQVYSPLLQRIGLKKSKSFIGSFIMSSLVVVPILAIHQNEVFRVDGCIFWRVNGYADDLLQVRKLELRCAACDLKHAAPSGPVFSIVIARIWMKKLQENVAAIHEE